MTRLDKIRGMLATTVAANEGGGTALLIVDPADIAALLAVAVSAAELLGEVDFEEVTQAALPLTTAGHQHLGDLRNAMAALEADDGGS